MRCFKYSVICLLTLIGCRPVEPVTCPVIYKELTLCFHTTVEEAVRQYKLSFKSPGHYYGYLADSTDMVLHYNYDLGDFWDEHQPESAFYDRIVDSYTFKMADKEGLFNQERRKLEMLTGNSMTLSKQQPTFIIGMADNQIATMPNQGSFTLAEGWTKDSVHVFLRNVPRLSPNQKPLLEVIFTKRKEPKKVKNLTHST